MKKLYVLMVYSYSKDYQKQIGSASSSYKKLEKAQIGLNNRIDTEKFYSIIEELNWQCLNFAQ